MIEDRLDELAGRARALAEELDDLSLELLHDAVRTGDARDSQRAAMDRKLVRARRAIEKAATLLAPAGGTED